MLKRNGEFFSCSELGREILLEFIDSLVDTFDVTDHIDQDQDSAVLAEESPKMDKEIVRLRNVIASRWGRDKRV